MRIITILAVLVLSAMASADPPCRVVQRQQVVAGSIHAATIYADTHLHLVEVPVPAYVFQTLTAYQPTVQAPVQQVPQLDGIGTDDRLAELLQVSSTPLQEISQKCAGCHSAQNGSSKGGLTIFDAQGQFALSNRSGKGITRGMLAARARSQASDAMPPGSDANPSKRLSEAAIRYLEQ